MGECPLLADSGRIFAAQMGGPSSGFQGTNTLDTPGLDQLRDAITTCDDWYQQYVSQVRADELAEQISFMFSDGERGAMTREEMLFHVLTHGAYHRGDVGMALTACGIDRPENTFTRFLHLSEPDRRFAI